MLALLICGCAANNQSDNSASTVTACPVDRYAASHPYSQPSGLPSDWDPSIPIPSGASVANSGETRGAVHSIDFSVTGHAYQQLVDFYINGLQSAGYSLTQSIEQKGQNTFNTSFAACGRLDTVSIVPDSANSFAVRIVYEPPSHEKKKTGPESEIAGLASACAFGDAEACKKVDAMSNQPGGIAAGAEHNAMIQEQLKSPEQRRMDLQRSRGFTDMPQ